MSKFYRFCKFFKREITIFEQMSTNMVANPMDIPLVADVVVAKVGHIPSTRAKVGFSLRIPFTNTDNPLFFIVGLLSVLDNIALYILFLHTLMDHFR